MAGQYTTQTREIPTVVARSYTRGLVGTAGQTFGTSNPVIPNGSQTTYSYRTVRGLGAEEAELAEDRRVLRNGFTTNDPVYDRGHEFWSSTDDIAETRFPEIYLQGWYPGVGDVFYRGPVILNTDSYSTVGLSRWSPVLPTSRSQYVTLGQRAITASAPTAPAADTATFIGELFAGLPSTIGLALIKERSSHFRSLGGEYLNVTFGWKPFVSDITKTVSALLKASKMITQMQRDSGRIVRRGFSFPAEVTVTDEGNLTPYEGPFWGIYNDMLASPLPTSVTLREEREVWFKGAFSYVLETDSGLLNKMSRYEALANKLLGTRVTPETLWNVAPWSWLIDWQFGIGDALRAASMKADDRLVIRYGYLMVKTTRTRTFGNPGTVMRRFPQYRIPVTTQTYRSVRKERFRATPYGFGLNDLDISPSRWAILGALGMTMAPTKSR